MDEGAEVEKCEIVECSGVSGVAVNQPVKVVVDGNTSTSPKVFSQ